MGWIELKKVAETKGLKDFFNRFYAEIFVKMLQKSKAKNVYFEVQKNLYK